MTRLYLVNNNDNNSTKNFHNKPAKAGGLSSLTSTLKHIIKSQQPKTNLKNLLLANTTDGFDCPGCAWGDKQAGFLHFCENGAKAIAWESTSKTTDAEFFAQYSVSQLLKQSDYWLEYQGRLTQPLKYDAKSDHYQAVSWEDAFELIAQHLNNLSSPNQAEFYTSGRASNEASFLYQLFGRIYGTNNFPDCSNMCHEASGVALKETIGIGKGTVVLDDFDKADAIFVFGQNPGTNHPRMMNALRSAARKGCKIVTFNNLKEVALERFASPQDPIELLTPSATKISHRYYTPKLGGDMAAIRGMVKVILTQNQNNIEQQSPEIIDFEFIQTHSVNFKDYADQVAKTSWYDIEQQSGLSQQEITDAANIFITAEHAICTWAMGITQHKHSVITIQELVNLQLLKGNIGIDGAGLCPVRGHSNVQGNRTMGINEQPPQNFLDQQAQVVQHAMPQKSGHNVYYALKALLNKQSKVLICLGGNLAQAAPDTEKTHQALRNSELNVQISTKLNRSHLLIGKDALILPCLGRTEIDRQAGGEQKITVEDTFSMVHSSKGKVEPLSSLMRSETNIVANIAQATLGNKTIDWQAMTDNYTNIRQLIANVVDGFEDYEHKLTQPGGFYLGNSARDKVWHTQSKKAQFTANPLPKNILHLDEEQLQQASQNSQNEHKPNTIFTLQSLRSHDQYNTTIYGMNDRYRGVTNDRKVLFINARDAQKLGFDDGDLVDITSIWHNNQTRKICDFKVFFYQIPRGNLAAYYPETNPLVPLDSFGDRSYTPTSKAIAVILTRATSKRII
ncbi:MAG: molybdopterin-dependent oxidoreductase alpha subunit [Alteromonadaceae bacterium]|jgi:molybdopterin-dependent oxidoreductase alpha subunit